jgi:two-component system OmpR family sensor kinase
MVVAGTGGWFLARRSFWPVTEMADRAAEISASTLHERLPVVADDELGALARVLNGLLDRLERSFADQRRFMADASHELRSPTAILRTETDVTLSREHRTEAEYRESMIIVQDAAHRLSRVVDDLFLLARADGGHLVMQPNLLYLDEVVGDTVRAARPLAEQKGLRVEVSSTVDAALRGDTDLLGRLLLNLLDNAIRHSPEGGTVRVVMEDRGETVEVAVVDSGPGIPPEAQSHVFERFFRLDAARSRDGSNLTTGAGLGLAIGRRIAEMHGGRLDLTMSQPGRTEFRLTLPVGDLDASTMQEDPSRGG